MFKTKILRKKGSKLLAVILAMVIMLGLIPFGTILTAVAEEATAEDEAASEPAMIMPLSAPGGNALLNGDFTAVNPDGSPYGWVMSNTASVEASLTSVPGVPDGVSGRAGLFTTKNTGDTGGMALNIGSGQYLPVKQGNQYELTFWARVPSGVFHVIFGQRSAVPTGIADQSTRSSGVDVHQWGHLNWTVFTIPYTPPAGVNFVRPVFQDWNPLDLEAYIADVTFRAVTPSGDVPAVIIDQASGETDAESISLSGTIVAGSNPFYALRVNGRRVNVSGNAFNIEIPLDLGETL